MGKAIYLFAGPADNRALTDFALSIGLRVLAPLYADGDISSSNPAKGPFCFLSLVPHGATHPYGNPLGIGPATDPLIEFMRSYFKDPYLVMGRIYCSLDSKRLAEKTVPYYSKLARWIRKNWERNSDRQYVGPHAKQLIEQGAIIAYLPPGVPITKLQARGNRDAQDHA